MSTWGSLDVGNRWTPSRTTTTQPRPQSLAPVSAPLNLGTLSVAKGSALNADGIRGRLDSASGTMRTAFAAFTSHSRPVFTTNVATRAAQQASFVGTAARLAPIAGSYSAVQTTVKVNTQASTTRSSASSIGFDPTAAHSRLSSAPLSLDVTSPERASTLSSTSALGLNVVDAPSTIQSSAEMNGAVKSLGSSSLALSGSTSQIEVSGSYTGNATALTFKMTKAATIREGGLFPANISLQVRDQNDDVVESYSGSVRAGDLITLSDIGLTVRLTEGTVAKNSVATTTVSASPANVNTSAAFNAAWGTAPLFENFRQVTAGSFKVNGVTIAVNANDSISSVLSRINGSAAGVTGTVSGDRVVLSSNTRSESDIVLSNDTSGFLLATKLSTATTTRGNIRDDQQVLSQTTQFGGVASGSFMINGVAIAVNRNTDSLDTVLSRINGAGAGVTASYQAASGKVILATTGNSEQTITVSGDATGLLSATGLSAAVTETGNVRDDLQVLSRTSRFAAVSDGTFQVNGQTIAVDVDEDSLSTLIQKINDAGAGVVARFDAAANRLELESDSDSEDPIAVGSDSTGFLSVAGLATGATVLGSIADSEQALSDTAAFAGVTAGSFRINGITVAVDPGADRLGDLLARINGASAGVTASYDSATDRLTFTPTVAGAALSLTDDTSGFLAAARVVTGAVGTRVDPNAAFDGSTGSGPLFDPGLSVQAGSFSVNGVTIAVAADDTVNSVLARVNSSSAGVTATYDSTTQLVRMTSTQHTASPITLGGDTSGVLAALKLDGTAQSTAGSPARPAFDSVIGGFSEYSGVAAGTLTVNGQQISIDPQTTTVRDLVTALDGVAGVDATLDEWTGGIRVVSTQSGGSITVADTSGVLSALGIAARTYSGSPATATVTETQTGTTIVSNGAEVAAGVRAAAEEFTAVLTELAGTRAGDDAFLNDLVAAATDAVEALGGEGIGGLTIGGEGSDVRLVVDREALASALDALSDPKALPRIVADVLSEFSTRVADVVSAAAPAPAPDLKTVNLTRPVVAATQAAAAALFQKALERVVTGTDAEQRSATDVADGALDLETRMRIRAQLEASEESTAYAGGELLHPLISHSR